MRILFILLAITLAGCASSPEGKVKRELGWNGVLNTYIQEAEKCQPGNVQPSCIIGKKEASLAITAINSYVVTRQQCLAQGFDNCDPCELVRAIGVIATVSGSNDFLPSCAKQFDLEQVFDELAATPEL